MGGYRNIVVLTGAGISAESGLGTFRDEDGLWAKYRIEDVATPEAFMRDPDLVQNFYNMRRRDLLSAKPNPAHEALARLEREGDGTVTVVTQNVDNLHEAAGSENVIHMHGELCKVRCTHCGCVIECTGDVDQTTPCSDCARVPALRPHVVWFGEMPFGMDRIERLLTEADLFVSIGTSGAVYPAAGFVATARSYGRAHTVELNMEPSEGRHFFAEGRYGKASEVVPAYVEEILGG